MQDDLWLSKGRHGGVLIQGAEKRLFAVSSAASITIDVLDAVIGDDRLAVSLAVKAHINDLKHGQFGREWDEERQAIATQTTDSFNSAWPEMRERLRENYLVSLVGSLENYVMSLLVEFPPLVAGLDSELHCSDTDAELDWKKADSSYRKAFKAKESASKAWVLLCRQSSIPEEVKKMVAQWGDDAINTHMVDEMVLVRNAIVHRAGVVGEKLAQHLKRRNITPGKKVMVSQESMAHYARAYWGFLASIEPSL